MWSYVKLYFPRWNMNFTRAVRSNEPWDVMSLIFCFPFFDSIFSLWAALYLHTLLSKGAIWIKFVWLVYWLVIYFSAFLLFLNVHLTSVVLSELQWKILWFFWYLHVNTVLSRCLWFRRVQVSASTCWQQEEPTDRQTDTYTHQQQQQQQQQRMF